MAMLFACMFLLGQSFVYGQVSNNLYVSFVVNEDLLIGQILNCTEKDSLSLDYTGKDNRIAYGKKITNLKNAAWQISQKWYECWSVRWEGPFNSFAWANLRNGSKGLIEFLDKVRETREFREVLNETTLRKEFCQKQWENNLFNSKQIIQEMTGLNVAGTYTVYVGYPGLAGGSNFGDNEIHWGGHEDWLNYTTVYIWHEILHSQIPGSQVPKAGLDHALIQLISDNELRERLNNLSDTYPPFEGHDGLISLETKILPYWKDYLKNPQKGIFEFRRMLIDKNIVSWWKAEKKK